MLKPANSFTRHIGAFSLGCARSLALSLASGTVCCPKLVPWLVVPGGRVMVRRGKREKEGTVDGKQSVLRGDQRHQAWDQRKVQSSQMWPLPTQHRSYESLKISFNFCIYAWSVHIFCFFLVSLRRLYHSENLSIASRLSILLVCNCL